MQATAADAAAAAAIDAAITVDAAQPPNVPIAVAELGSKPQLLPAFAGIRFGMTWKELRRLVPTISPVDEAGRAHANAGRRSVEFRFEENAKARLYEIDVLVMSDDSARALDAGNDIVLPVLTQAWGPPLRAPFDGFYWLAPEDRVHARWKPHQHTLSIGAYVPVEELLGALPDRFGDDVPAPGMTEAQVRARWGKPLRTMYVYRGPPTELSFYWQQQVTLTEDQDGRIRCVALEIDTNGSATEADRVLALIAKKWGPLESAGRSSASTDRRNVMAGGHTIQVDQAYHSVTPKLCAR